MYQEMIKPIIYWGFACFMICIAGQAISVFLSPDEKIGKYGRRERPPIFIWPFSKGELVMYAFLSIGLPANIFISRYLMSKPELNIPDEVYRISFIAVVLIAIVLERILDR